MVLDRHAIVTVNKSLTEINGDPSIQRGKRIGSPLKSIQVTDLHGHSLTSLVKGTDRNSGKGNGPKNSGKSNGESDHNDLQLLSCAGKAPDGFLKV
jgi:hypothetical protein